jgi:hypothetical protein
MTIKVKNNVLPNFREFRKGMDVEEFLQNDFRQMVRALKNQFVDPESVRSSFGLSKYVESESTGVVSYPSASGTVDVANLSVSLEASGGIVVIGLAPVSTLVGSVGVSSSSTSFAESEFYLLKNSSLIYSTELNTGDNSTATSVSLNSPCSVISFIDSSLTTGTLTYSIRARALTGSVRFTNVKLFAYEIF